MTKWDAGLSGVHRTIASDDGNVILVFAGPGTGKTYAMMRRIGRLLEAGCSSEKILAVTFTRTAARDLKEQLGKLGVPRADKVRATTLHAFCFGVLASEHAFKATGRIARPTLEFEKDVLVEDLAGVFGGKKKVRKLLKAYEAAWARLQHEQPGYAKTKEDAQFEVLLLDWLTFHRAILIGELVPLILTFLRQNPSIDAIPSFTHVLTDEYQDLNRADQVMVEHLAANGALFVAGDDRQSIYRFRHANPEGIRVFANEHSGTHSYDIRQCRRCPPNIVQISNSLISHDALSAGRPLLVPDTSKPPAEIRVVQHPTLLAEVTSIADYIQWYLSINAGVPPGQVLVLTPRRFIGNGIRDRLIQRGLNSLSYFLEDQLANTPAAEGFALLTLLVDQTDRTAFRSWLSLGSTSGLVGGYRKLREAAQVEGREPSEVLAEVAAGKRKLTYSGGLVARFEKLQERLAVVRPLAGLELVRALWPDEESRDIRLVAENLALENPDASALLMALREQITQPELAASSADIVRVMSLHKSKGLTARVVIAAGCVAGVLPGVDPKTSPAEQDAQREEQRRLFYVAITRPTDVLVISSAAAMTLKEAKTGNVDILATFFDGSTPMARTAASPFITELGATAPTAMTTAQWRTEVGF